MAKERLSLADALKKEDAHTYEEAQKKADELKTLKEETPLEKKAGRPMEGKTKAKNKIAFYVNDETLEWLESKTDRKKRTPNAVSKKLIMNIFETMKGNK
jgi:hypothetical protein